MPTWLRVAIGDGEAILRRIGADAGADVAMPVGIGRRGVEVLAEDRPAPGQDSFRTVQAAAAAPWSTFSKAGSVAPLQAMLPTAGPRAAPKRQAC